MKKQWGPWLVDTEASTLVYDSGQEIRIFTVPPDAALTPADVLAWVIRAYPPGRPTGNEIEDLAGAVRDLLGLTGRTPSAPGRSAIWTLRRERDEERREGKSVI